MSKLRVLYLVPQPNRPGETAKYSFLTEEIRALASAGVEPYVLYRSDVPLPTIRHLALTLLPFIGRSFRSIPPRNLASRACLPTFMAEQFAATLVQRERIDLVHSHFAWPGGSGGLLTKAATGRPLIASLRGNDIILEPSIGYGARRQAAFHRALTRLLARADRTVYFSDWMRKRAEQLGAAPERCRVVRKGVDLRRFHVGSDRESLKARLGFAGRPMLLSAAGLIPRKGIDDILRALSLLKEYHDFHYVVCGDGPLAQDLRNLANELGVGSQTTFVGRVSRDTIADYFRACDIFVHAAVLEAAGNVILEAMASGRPVVCTDSGGPAEYVRREETGLIVPVRDPAALQGSIRRFLDDPDLAERFGTAGRRVAEQHADYSTMTTKILNIYDEVLRESRRRRTARERRDEGASS